MCKTSYITATAISSSDNCLNATLEYANIGGSELRHADNGVKLPEFKHQGLRSKTFEEEIH